MNPTISMGIQMDRISDIIRTDRKELNAIIRMINKKDQKLTIQSTDTRLVKKIIAIVRNTENLLAILRTGRKNMNKNICKGIQNMKLGTRRTGRKILNEKLPI